MRARLLAWLVATITCVAAIAAVLLIAKAKGIAEADPKDARVVVGASLVLGVSCGHYVYGATRRFVERRARARDFPTAQVRPPRERA
jgi:hypothetical protein